MLEIVIGAFVMFGLVVLYCDVADAWTNVLRRTRRVYQFTFPRPPGK